MMANEPYEAAAKRRAELIRVLRGYDGTDLGKMVEQSRDVSQAIEELLLVSAAETDYRAECRKDQHKMNSRVLAWIAGPVLLAASWAHVYLVNEFAQDVAARVVVQRELSQTETEDRVEAKATGTEQKPAETKRVTQKFDATLWPRLIVFLSVHGVAAALPIALAWLLVRRGNVE